MTVINSNTSALRATNASAAANKALSTSMERLSTGKRINSAKDDAAGLAISSSMTAQIRGMNQGVRNANDGISMAQTAEGALDFVLDLVDRLEGTMCQVAMVRMDAGFPEEKLLAGLEARGTPYVARIRNNRALDRMAVPHLRRPPGRPPAEPRRRAPEWT